jgi:hypothetical protein
MNSFAILLECDPGNSLGGSCQRDLLNMKKYLISECNFKEENVITLFSKECTKFGFSKDLFSVFEYVLTLKPDTILILISGHGKFSNFKFSALICRFSN